MPYAFASHSVGYTEGSTSGPIARTWKDPCGSVPDSPGHAVTYYGHASDLRRKIVNTPVRSCLLAGFLAFSVIGCRDDMHPVTDPSFDRVRPGPSFDWTMPARFGPDRDGDGLTDYLRTTEEISPAAWTVNFDACALPPGMRYTWYVNKRPVAAVAECHWVHEFPAEGTYDVAVHVVGGGGPSVWAEEVVTVQDWLIVSFGDSYASGEGVPEVQSASDDVLHDIDNAVANLVEARRQRDAAAASLQQAFENKGLGESILATQQQRLSDFLNACSIESFKSITECAEFLAGLPFETFNSARDHFLQGVSDAQERVNSLTQAWQNALAAFNAVQNAVTDIQNTIAQLRAGLQTAKWQPPYPGQDWGGDDCHRSANSAPARAALALEQSDPHTSVTFIHLACSGGRIDQKRGNLKQQIALANQLVGQREIDAMLLSIGGNDAGFAAIGTACAVQQPCYVDDPALDLADANGVCLLLGVIGFEGQCTTFFGNFPTQSAKHILQEGVDSLPIRYDTLANNYLPTLTGLLAAGTVRSNRVYIAEYGDLTKDDGGAYCRFDNTDPLGAMPGVTTDEMEWLDLAATRSIDGAVATAAVAHGWNLVSGIYQAYRDHGYCATNHWVNRIHESLLRQGDIRGLLHPNNAGQITSAGAIVNALMRDLYPEGPAGAPRAPDQPVAFGPITAAAGFRQ